LAVLEVHGVVWLLKIIWFAPSIPRVSVALIRIVGGAVGCHPIFPPHNSVSLFASFQAAVVNKHVAGLVPYT
jgi:hypothetical protein